MCQQLVPIFLHVAWTNWGVVCIHSNRTLQELSACEEKLDLLVISEEAGKSGAQ